MDRSVCGDWGAGGNQGYVGGITLRNTDQPTWALWFSMRPSFHYSFLVLLSHYFSENDPVGLNFSMLGTQLGLLFLPVLSRSSLHSASGVTFGQLLVDMA